MSELIEKKTRQILREYFVSTTLRTIRDAFDLADIIESDIKTIPIHGERRALVERYYRSINFSRPIDVQKFLKVCGNVLGDLEELIANEEYFRRKEAQAWLAKLTNCLKRDGYRWHEGRMVPTGGSLMLEVVKAHAVELDADHLLTQIDRIEKSVESDPAQAIGSAKELLETCCKLILSERGKAVTSHLEVPELIGLTLKELELVPEAVSNASKGAETIKKLLRTLATTAVGLAELRNLYGTGHGKDGNFRGLSPRHSRLGVGAAKTVATFLLETHKARRKKD